MNGVTVGRWLGRGAPGWLSYPRPGGTGAGAVAGGDGFPAVPDVEFPQSRAAARRLLAVPAFARVDHDTFGLARAQADDLRLSLLGQTSRAELTDAVLQQHTIDATSTDEVLTRVRAAQAGLFAEGLFVDLRPQTSPPGPPPRSASSPGSTVAP